MEGQGEWAKSSCNTKAVHRQDQPVSQGDKIPELGSVYGRRRGQRKGGVEEDERAV